MPLRGPLAIPYDECEIVPLGTGRGCRFPSGDRPKDAETVLVAGELLHKARHNGPRRGPSAGERFRDRGVADRANLLRECAGARRTGLSVKFAEGGRQGPSWAGPSLLTAGRHGSPLLRCV